MANLDLIAGMTDTQFMVAGEMYIAKWAIKPASATSVRQEVRYEGPPEYVALSGPIWFPPLSVEVGNTELSQPSTHTMPSRSVNMHILCSISFF